MRTTILVAALVALMVVAVAEDPVVVFDLFGDTDAPAAAAAPASTSTTTASVPASASTRAGSTISADDFDMAAFKATSEFRTATPAQAAGDPLGAPAPTQPPSAKAPTVLVVTTIWNGDLSAPTEQGLFQLATHPYVGGTLKVVMSSLHRARNHGIQYLFESKGLAAFSHLLFVHQDTVFELHHLDLLLAAGKPVISGITVQRYAPFLPRYMPLGASAADVQRPEYWYDRVREISEATEPIQVDAVGFEFTLVDIGVLQQTERRYGSKREWFWLEGTKHGEYMHLEDEDLTFCNTLRAAGIPVYIHPQVQIEQEIVASVGLHHFVHHRVATEVFRGHQPSGEAVVVENKLAGLRRGMRYKVKEGKARGSVVVATATWRGINPETHASLWAMAQNPAVVGRVAITQQTLVLARNSLMQLIEREFGSSWTHVLFVDADMTFKSHDLDVLLAADKPIIFGLAVKRLQSDHPPAYMPLNGNPLDHSALLEALTARPIPPIEVKGGGMAFTLIRREVLDKIKRPILPGIFEWFWCERYIDEDSGMAHHLSEDYTFGRAARRAGFSVWMHAGVQVGHMDMEELNVSHWFRARGLSYDRIA